MRVNANILVAGAATALLALTAASPIALAQQVSSPDPHAVKAGTYKVEPYHTQVSFSISHFGFTDFYGLFSGASGTLQLDPSTPSASKLEVSIPVTSILTTVPVLDNELKNAQWFDVAKYPTATFNSTKVVRTGNDTATVTGDLTLHGVTKQETLQVRLVGSGVNPLDKSFTVGFEAVGTIKRSDFGVTQYVPLVGDDVALKIAGAFVRQQ
ncbi:MAG: polyisoprenoid-binding protein [Caulobacteraceae bacterium]|nr:polyisoprenoid-binding protein [Caulobacteraceae bacterium]